MARAARMDAPGMYLEPRHLLHRVRAAQRLRLPATRSARRCGALASRARGVAVRCSHSARRSNMRSSAEACSSAVARSAEMRAARRDACSRPRCASSRPSRMLARCTSRTRASCSLMRGGRGGCARRGALRTSASCWSSQRYSRTAPSRDASAGSRSRQRSIQRASSIAVSRHVRHTHPARARHGASKLAKTRRSRSACSASTDPIPARDRRAAATAGGRTGRCRARTALPVGWPSWPRVGFVGTPTRRPPPAKRKCEKGKRFRSSQRENPRTRASQSRPPPANRDG